MPWVKPTHTRTASLNATFPSLGSLYAKAGEALRGGPAWVTVRELRFTCLEPGGHSRIHRFMLEESTFQRVVPSLGTVAPRYRVLWEASPTELKVVALTDAGVLADEWVWLSRALVPFLQSEWENLSTEWQSVDGWAKLPGPPDLDSIFEWLGSGVVSCPAYWPNGLSWPSKAPIRRYLLDTISIIWTIIVLVVRHGCLVTWLVTWLLGMITIVIARDHGTRWRFLKCWISEELFQRLNI